MASEAKFSSGPWRIAGKGTIRRGTDEWIARVYWRNQVANAHLINAAPELYEALERITDCYGIGSPPDKFLANVHDFMMGGRAALSKARGEL